MVRILCLQVLLFQDGRLSSVFYQFSLASKTATGSLYHFLFATLNFFETSDCGPGLLVFIRKNSPNGARFVKSHLKFLFASLTFFRTWNHRVPLVSSYWEAQLQRDFSIGICFVGICKSWIFANCDKQVPFHSSHLKMHW